MEYGVNGYDYHKKQYLLKIKIKTITNSPNYIRHDCQKHIRPQSVNLDSATPPTKKDILSKPESKSNLPLTQMHHPEDQPYHETADIQGPYHNTPNMTGKVLEEARGHHSDLTTILEDLQLAELIYQSELKHLGTLDEALQINPHLNPELIRQEIAGICRNLMTTGYRPPKRTADALEIACTKTQLDTATTQIRGNTASDYWPTENEIIPPLL